MTFKLVVVKKFMKIRTTTTTTIRENFDGMDLTVKFVQEGVFDDDNNRTRLVVNVVNNIKGGTLITTELNCIALPSTGRCSRFCLCCCPTTARASPFRHACTPVQDELS
jgi:hypothetical protein